MAKNYKKHQNDIEQGKREFADRMRRGQKEITPHDVAKVLGMEEEYLNELASEKGELKEEDTFKHANDVKTTGEIVWQSVYEQNFFREAVEFDSCFMHYDPFNPKLIWKIRNNEFTLYLTGSIDKAQFNPFSEIDNLPEYCIISSKADDSGMYRLEIPQDKVIKVEMLTETKKDLITDKYDYRCRIHLDNRHIIDTHGSFILDDIVDGMEPEGGTYFHRVKIIKP